MAYAPNEPGAVVPGTFGDAAAWDAIISNDAELYATHKAGYAATAQTLTVTGASLTDIAIFAIPANYDQMQIRVTFLYSVEAGATAGVVKLSVTDGSATDSATTTGLSGDGGSTVTVTLSASSASSTPRYGILSSNASAGKYIAIVSFTAGLVPAAAAAGALRSGYASVGSTWNAANAPIPTQVVQRLSDNPFIIAKDRPSAVYSFIDQLQDARYGVVGLINATEYQMVLRPFIPKLAHIEKTYRVWVYVERTSTALADVQINVGNEQISLLDSHGIMTSTFTSTGSNLTSGQYGVQGVGSIQIRKSSGSGYVALRTVQILEEPSGA